MTTVLLTAVLLLPSGVGLAGTPARAAMQVTVAQAAPAPPGPSTPAPPSAGITEAPEPDISPLTTGSITPAIRPQSAGVMGSIDRRLLMALMMIGFVGMASASVSLWRRSIRDFIQAERKRRGR
ncbi:hypothetical protein [Ciceribacter sp. RN22]|uniref:hypothetical protein n=1 Tax=Ciceribacter sp. RN22 TaxID=2954932 RepID=UPI00209348C0|nr:hypothetical protein [Ciceribacter sp. RN22]MCO6178878.1 hypothetical protein [Ciceribacter sp. RN22]